MISKEISWAEPKDMNIHPTPNPDCIPCTPCHTGGCGLAKALDVLVQDSEVITAWHDSAINAFQFGTLFGDTIVSNMIISYTILNVCSKGHLLETSNSVLNLIILVNSQFIVIIGQKMKLIS